MPTPFPALRHRDFRLFWTGQCVSLVGTWMQNVAQGWLVLQLTDSSLLLGLVGAVQFLPVTFVSFYAGVVADCYPKRSILLVTQSSLALLAAALALLTWTGAIRYEYVLALALLLGVVNSFDMPTRQAYVIELVGREDVMNAVALNSSVFNAARILGPALAGWLMGLYGAAVCFGLNALSFLAVILSLYLIAPGKRGERLIQRAAWPEIKSGARYILGQRTIRDALVLLGVLSVFAMNFNVLIPVFARFTLRGGARTYGLLMSCMGAGALGGSLSLALLYRRGVSRRLLFLAGTGLCASLLLLALVRSSLPACAVLFFTGWTMVSFNASVNTTLQISTDDLYRGRVMSVYAVFLAGLTPVGSFFAGFVAQAWGPPLALALGAGVGLAGVGLMAIGNIISPSGRRK